MNIQKILILIDLNSRLHHLLAYGLPLAHQLNAQLWVQYAYDIPPELTGEVYISEDTIEAYKKAVYDTLSGVEKKLHTSLQHTPRVVVSVGNLAHKMNLLIDQENIDLVLVGNKIGGGWLNYIFENNTVDVIRHARCPVLAVPEAAAFHPFQRLALATDLKQTNAKVLGRFLDFAMAFQAQTDVIHISDTPEDALKMEIQLDRSLRAIPHQFFNILAKNIEEGIEQHVAQYHNDLVVLIPRDHPFFERLFQKSITRQVTYHAKVPLLTIHASHVH